MRFCAGLVGFVDELDELDELDGPDIECMFCLEFDGGNEFRPLVEAARECRLGGTVVV